MKKVHDDGISESVAPVPAHVDEQRFWEKPLDQLTPEQWERLCDGCGRCCLVKLEDEDTGDVHFTSVGCKLLDASTCRCRDYPNRERQVPDCVRLDRDNVGRLEWLPVTCAYRLRARGEALAPWHPLLSGDPDSVVRAGISVRDRVAASEDDVDLDDLPSYITRWPNRWPKRARRPVKG